ncbi:hypothetical protein QZH41_010980 [Actinostola sp. cb2023]|nr:hypothetical protein QZH41_010980 [Actinostola sp. cb2023]
MGTPRCGMPDKSPADKARRKRRYTLHGTYWRKKDITYRIKGYTSDITVADQHRIYKWAFEQWNKASKITVTEAPRDIPDDKVDILIDWKRGYHGDGYPFDGPGGTLAHAFYPHNNKGIAGDAHFDDGERYTTRRSDGVNLDWVALHEFGHSLGLDHSSVRGSIMFHGKPSGGGEPTEIPKGTGPVPTRNPHVDECRLSKYDAWLYDDQDDKTYAFAGEYYFIVNPRTVGVMEGPLKIADKWKHVRTPVSAVYKRADRSIVFFSGGYYWKYLGNYLEQGPRPISTYRLPAELKEMDGAFMWGRNQRTYFIKGNKYWRYNERYRHVDAGYPKDLSVWKGIPKNIDAVMKWKNGKTYFFKGNAYYKLDDYSITIEANYPRSIARKWMRCDPSRLLDSTTAASPTKDDSGRDVDAGKQSSGSAVLPSLVMLVLSYLTAGRLC